MIINLKQSQSKGRILWVAGSILAILIAGPCVTWWTIHRADRLMREDFLQTARLVAQAISSDRIKKLSGTEADLTSFEYLQLKEQLIAAQTAYPECRSPYLLGRRDDGEIFFYVDSVSAGSKDESPPGHVYEGISQKYLPAFQTKTETTIGPITDHRGTWVTSLIPIKNTTTGELIAFLGMDIDGNDWKWKAVQKGFVPVLATLILIVLVSAGSFMMAWRSKPITKNIRALNYIEAGMAAAIGVTVTLLSIWMANNYEIRNNKRIFYHILNTKTIGVTSVLETLQNVELEGLSSIFSLRQHVTGESFRDFTKYLENNSAIQGLAWVPVVPSESKLALEQYGRQELTPDYEIWERDPSGNRIQVNGRPFYYPTYFESFKSNGPGLGFDLGSEPIKAKTLEVARLTGHTLCTEPFQAEDGSGQQDDILVFRPVYEKDKPELLLGFATAEVKMGTLLKTAAASGLDNTPLSMELYMLHKSGQAIRLSSVTIGEDGSDKNESFSITRPIFIFGRTFAVVVRPGSRFEALRPGRYGGIVGLAGLIITAAITLVIGFIVHRKEKLELLVHERTGALQESEEKFRALVENNNDAIMRFDLEHRHLYVNPIVQAETGISQSEFFNKTHEELGFPEDLCALFNDALDKVFDSGKVNRVEFQLPKGIWIDWMVIPEMDEYGQVKAVITTSRNITERKREEEEREKLRTQLAHAHKMESVGRLAGGVAHDFNNMLSVIIGYSELALREIAANDPLHTQLQEIRKAASRSADLTRQLLAFARKQTVSPKLVDLNEIVGNTIKMLARLIDENIHLTWLPDINKLPVNIDPTQVDQILTNLCVNARDAISGIGSITIETHLVIIDKYYCAVNQDVIPGEYVELCISDNGCGMDKATLENIFEPFFTTKESGKGTGLGLATVYGIVKQNNGFINVYSELGKGTTFKIYLPFCVAKSLSAQKESTVGHGTLGHETILLVEDEPGILDIGKLMLESLGYQVLTASKPGEAIHLAKEYKGDINLLITDVVMPEMNGRDLAKNILAFYPGIKRLFMSGYTSDVIAYHGILDEGIHFIHKPFTLEDLSVRVREAIDTK